MIHAWYADTRYLCRDEIDSALRLLSPEERARHDRLSLTEERRDYAAAHALLRLALAAQTNISPKELRLGSDLYGKPFLPSQPQLSFSLARTRGLAACAIAAGYAVGIDIETVDESLPAVELARDFFSANEASAIAEYAAGDRPSRFCELWTLKEALLKAIGTGLGWPLNCVTFDVRRRRVELTHLPPFVTRRWAFLTVNIGTTHKLAIAVGDRGTT